MKALVLKLADHGWHREMLKTIQWALIERRQLAGLYKTPYQDQPVELTLHLLRLFLTGQAWYLIARPVAGDVPKTYRVMRFRRVRLLDAVAAADAWGDRMVVLLGDAVATGLPAERILDEVT